MSAAVEIVSIEIQKDEHGLLLEMENTIKLLIICTLSANTRYIKTPATDNSVN